MELAVIGILIVLIVLVICLLHIANVRAKDWENKYNTARDQYYEMRDTNIKNKNKVDELSKQIEDLSQHISALDNALELERKYNKKANDTYIAKTDIKVKGLKEEINNLKKAKYVSRSKMVQYITQHSNFTPTQMNNQTTDNLLDYYWYLYLMNTAITEDSKSSTNSDNSTVSKDKSGLVEVVGTLYDSDKESFNRNHYTVEEMRSFASSDKHNIVSDEHGQITSIPNDVYAEKLFNQGKTFGNYDDSSKSSDSSYSDDSCGSSSSHYSGSSFSSSDSSSSSWGSSDYSSGSSYDSGSSGGWGSSDSSSCDSGGGDW